MRRTGKIGKVKVRLTITRFANWCHHSPSQSDVQRQVVCHTPIVLNERAEEFPAPTGGSAFERLVVNRPTDLTQKNIRYNIPCKEACLNEEAILEGIGLNVHLMGANRAANPYVMLATNHVKRVGDGEHVGSALEWRKPAIAQAPIRAHEGRNQTATDTVFR